MTDPDSKPIFHPKIATYLYLHGFASSARSAKGVYLQQQLQHQYGIDLQLPDFNQGGFEQLTISRQIEQARAALLDTPTVLIGSSLGGLTAAWVADSSPQVKRLVLLAPAFQFADRWLAALGAEALTEWRSQGQREFFHYGEGRPLPLSYRFVDDARQYDETRLQRPVPTTILHGQRDEVVPISVSRTYAASRPWVKLHELDSDHSLGDRAALATIWQTLQDVCQLR
jgi:pimeloyl-ACP methyl ester carboxylesterase